MLRTRFSFTAHSRAQVSPQRRVRPARDVIETKTIGRDCADRRAAETIMLGEYRCAHGPTPLTHKIRWPKMGHSSVPRGEAGDRLQLLIPSSGRLIADSESYLLIAVKLACPLWLKSDFLLRRVRPSADVFGLWRNYHNFHNVKCSNQACGKRITYPSVPDWNRVVRTG